MTAYRALPRSPWAPPLQCARAHKDLAALRQVADFSRQVVFQAPVVHVVGKVVQEDVVRHAWGPCQAMGQALCTES
jgi:hypothetical protein